MLLASLALASACYSPNLSDEPFSCGASAPECPDGYDCVNGVCTSSGGGGGSGDGNCPDSDIEPNDSISDATQTSGGQRPTLTLEPLAICPAGDIDVFAFTTPGTEAAITASITYGASGPALSMQLQNSSGESVVTPTTTGNEVSAFVQNPGINTTYYVVVQGQDAGAENTYSLTITTSE